MKLELVLALILLQFSKSYSQSDPIETALCRAGLCAQELSYYNAFSKSEDNTFRCLTEQLKNKEVFFYDKGEIFRKCRSKNNQLNGDYEIFYRNGSVFLKTIYKNGQLHDSTTLFDENARVFTKIFYTGKDQYNVLHYYENGQIKKNIQVNHKVDCTDYMNLYNSERFSSLIRYYDIQGKEISRENYLIQNPSEQTK